MYIRHKKWKVVLDPPEWNATGYDQDRIWSALPPSPLRPFGPEARVADCFSRGARSCRSFLSEAIVHYKLAPPWVEARDYEKPDWKELGYDSPMKYKRPWMHTVYLRIERHYQYEVHKIIVPLFIIVLMSAASFGLEPDATDQRIAAPIGMMLATIGVMYTIQGEVPKVPESTWIDTYINVCIIMIALVVGQTIALKQYLEGARFGNVATVERFDNGTARGAATTNVVGERSIASIHKDSVEWVMAENVDFICMGIALVFW